MRDKRATQLFIAIAAFAALRLCIPYARVFGGFGSAGAAADMAIFTTAFMAAQILVIRNLCSLQPRLAVGGAVFVLSLAAFAALLTLKLTIGAGVWLDLSLDLGRLLAAAFLGYVVSFSLLDKNIVLPVAGFAAYLDIWMVVWGPTKYFVTQAPEVVQAVSAPIPAPGGHGAVVSFIGPADFVFLAIFFGAIYRLRMEPARTYWFALPLLAGAMLMVITMPHFRHAVGLPALVPIGVAVIAANYRHFRLEKQEKLAVIVVSGLLAAALAVFLLAHRG